MRLLDCFLCIIFLLPLYRFLALQMLKEICVCTYLRIYIYEIYIACSVQYSAIFLFSRSHFLQKFSLKLRPLRNLWLLCCWLQQSQGLYLQNLGQKICFQWNFHHWLILHPHCPDAHGDFGKVCMGHLNFRLDCLQAGISKTEVLLAPPSFHRFWTGN